ncbi:MAG: glycosyltransferase family 2 protein [Flavobacteriales bacterium]
MPSISVIIPVYNGKRTLAEALKSVWQQTLPAFEILVIDGGSSDGTIDLLQASAHRITHWVSEPDRGVYDAINKGIRKATGDWIYILGSDDQLASADVFERVSSALTASTDLVFGSVRNANIRHSMVPEVHISSVGTGLYIRNTLHQQSAFYNRRLFEQAEFDTSMRVLADYDFHLLLFKRRVNNTPIDLVIATCEASGLSKQFNAALYMEEFRLKKKRLGVVVALLLSPIIGAKFLLKQLR